MLVLQNFLYRSVLVSKATHVPLSGPSDEGPAEKGITSPGVDPGFSKGGG